MTSPEPLSALPNETGAVIDTIAGTDAGLAEQLRDNGFVPGQKVEVLRRGLVGGTPLAVRLGRSVMALRREEAEAVLVVRS